MKRPEVTVNQNQLRLAIIIKIVQTLAEGMMFQDQDLEVLTLTVQKAYLWMNWRGNSLNLIWKHPLIPHKRPMLMVGRHKATAADCTSQTSVKKSTTSIISVKRNKNEVPVTMTMTSSCTPICSCTGLAICPVLWIISRDLVTVLFRACS